MLIKKKLVQALAIALVASTAAAQDTAATDEAEAAPSTLDTVIVTGTRTQTRTVAESLAPIDVLNVEQIENSGTPELQAVLARQVPSFNFPRTSISDGSDHVRPAQLRGLAPDQTLVLINGKRRHRTSLINVNGTIGRGSSPVDLNAIPTAAIRSIEVLRDGAAAQYGSDAIAGVINIILKDSAEGGSVSARMGEYDEGDGDLFQLSGNIGLSPGADGFLNLTAESRDKDPTNRAGLDLRQQYPLVLGLPDPREATFNRLNHRFGDADTQDMSFFFNFGAPVGDNHDVYAFGGMSNRQGEAAGFYRRALDSRNVPSIYPDGFLPLIASDVDDRSFTGGLRGMLGENWDFDLSYSFGSSNFDFDVNNSLNTSIGATSPTNFYAGNLYSSQDVFNLDLRRGYDLGGLYGPLNVAVGTEWREERFRLSEGDPASYFGTGSQVFPGFRPSDASDNSRDNWSVYVDLETEFTERFSGGAAFRYEDYSDFGDTLSGKISGRFEVTDSFAIRGTASTGFRAPNLQQQYYATTATNFIGGIPFDVRTFPVSSPVAIALGAEPLRPEESESFSIGFVAEPLDGLRVTADFYQIDIDDRIVLSETLTGAAVEAFLLTQGFPGVTGGRYFTNAIDTRTKGFDIVATYDFDLGNAGNLAASLAYNNNDTEITFIAPNPTQLQSNGLNLQRIGPVEIGRITVGSPEDKLVLGGLWTKGNFSVDVSATQYGRWQVLNNNPVRNESFGAQWITDLAVSYKWNDLKFTLGAENLFDEYPPLMMQDLVFDANGFASSGPLDNSFVGILPYARGEAPFGFNGRFLYGKVTWNF